jgi:hypothetical protein
MAGGHGITARARLAGVSAARPGSGQTVERADAVMAPILHVAVCGARIRRRDHEQTTSDAFTGLRRPALQKVEGGEGKKMTSGALLVVAKGARASLPCLGMVSPVKGFGWASLLVG